MSCLEVKNLNSRFTRKTLGCSKCLRNHRFAVALQVKHFNFCREHSAHNQTPAMEAVITDHVWTLEKIVGLIA
jgi:hypothetical protein